MIDAVEEADAEHGTKGEVSHGVAGAYIYE